MECLPFKNCLAGTWEWSRRCRTSSKKRSEVILMFRKHPKMASN